MDSQNKLENKKRHAKRSGNMRYSQINQQINQQIKTNSNEEMDFHNTLIKFTGDELKKLNK